MRVIELVTCQWLATTMGFQYLISEIDYIPSHFSLGQLFEKITGLRDLCQTQNLKTGNSYLYGNRAILYFNQADY